MVASRLHGKKNCPKPWLLLTDGKVIIKNTHTHTFLGFSGKPLYFPNS